MKNEMLIVIINDDMVIFTWNDTSMLMKKQDAINMMNIIQNNEGKFSKNYLN